MGEAEMRQIAAWIAAVTDHVKTATLPTNTKERAAFIKQFKEAAENDPTLLQIRGEVKALATQFPLFAEPATVANQNGHVAVAA